MPSDGGYVALSGFLYQMIGVLGLRAWAEIGTDSTSESDGVNILLKLVRDGNIRHEGFDQDAVLDHFGITDQDDSAIVQFKYSRKGKASNIAEKELNDIAKSIVRSVSKAQKIGQTISKYFLVTNRSLGPSAKKLLQRLGKIGQQSEEENVLIALKIITDLPKSKFEDRLRQFSQSFGLEEQETENGISELVGDLLKKAAHGTSEPITKQTIIKAFTGDFNTRPLTVSAVLELSRNNIELALKDWIKVDRGQLIQRDFLDQIRTQTIERAFVCVCGDGGCGKTTVLSQWAYENIEMLTEQAGAFTCIQKAKTVTRNWIVDIVKGWGNLPDTLLSRTSNPEDALKRLANANLGVHKPILQLGLDGIDETTDVQHKNEIREIMSWFRQEDLIARQNGEQPIATLLVTCRKKENVDELRAGDGFWDEDDHPSIIQITDFSDEELKEAVRTSAPDLYTAIVAVMDTKGFQPSSTSEIFAADGFPPSDDFCADRQIVESLKHPAMWRSFIKLDGSDRRRVIKGAHDALYKMASIFTEWCVFKIRSRLDCLEKEEILAVLKNVASECFNESSSRYAREKFINSAIATKLPGINEASKLYNECKVSGIIRMDSQLQWRWRHNFVLRFLINSNG